MGITIEYLMVIAATMSALGAVGNWVVAYLERNRIIHERKWGLLVKIASGYDPDGILLTLCGILDAYNYSSAICCKVRWIWATVDQREEKEEELIEKIKKLEKPGILEELKKLKTPEELVEELKKLGILETLKIRMRLDKILADHLVDLVKLLQKDLGIHRIMHAANLQEREVRGIK